MSTQSRMRMGGNSSLYGITLCVDSHKANSCSHMWPRVFIDFNFKAIFRSSVKIYIYIAKSIGIAESHGDFND